MREWMRIKCRYEERVVDAILLCIYKRDYYRLKKIIVGHSPFQKNEKQNSNENGRNISCFHPLEASRKTTV